ncbi:hypothetical protein DFJ73DRAFT_915074 [Zopfochytrium polystomum]|nr:hypothetical protein DFJ73DRAFT_915074 [Zopfochytrium polystomum]
MCGNLPKMGNCKHDKKFECSVSNAGLQRKTFQRKLLVRSFLQKKRFDGSKKAVCNSGGKIVQRFVYSESSNQAPPFVMTRNSQAPFAKTSWTPHGYIPQLRENLEKSATQWCFKNYYYPGVTLVQTSGSGKSRAVAQLASQTAVGAYGLRVVYCNFMKPGSTGYPKQSKIADKLVCCLDEKVFKCYFAACFEKVMEGQPSKTQESLELQTTI